MAHHRVPRESENLIVFLMSATSAYVVARPNLLRVFQYWPGPFTSQKGIAAFIKTTVLLDGSQDILRIVVLTFIEPQN